MQTVQSRRHLLEPQIPQIIVYPNWRGTIEAIDLLGDGLQKQLYIRPTNVKAFLSHFGPLMRFFLRMNLMNGAPIAIAQSFLEKPIEEILQQLQDVYAQELDSHHLQLLPARFR